MGWEWGGVFAILSHWQASLLNRIFSKHQSTSIFSELNIFGSTKRLNYQSWGPAQIRPNTPKKHNTERRLQFLPTGSVFPSRSRPSNVTAVSMRSGGADGDSGFDAAKARILPRPQGLYQRRFVDRKKRMHFPLSSPRVGKRTLL